MHLFDKAVKNAKPTDKVYRLKDGEGLYLQVDPKGGKYWRLLPFSSSTLWRLIKAKRFPRANITR